MNIVNSDKVIFQKMPQLSVPDVPELNVDSCDVELAWEAAAAAAIAEKRDERFSDS